MSEKKPSIWKRVAGYIAFSLCALFAMFFLTFPYEALQSRVRLEADNAGYFLRIGKMGPGLFSVRAADVEMSKKAVGDQVPEALKIESVSVGPSLFPPGLSVKLNVLGGTVATRLSGVGSTRIKVDIEDLDLSKGNLKGFSGIDFAGEVEAHVDLSIPRVAAGGPKRAGRARNREGQRHHHARHQGPGHQRRHREHHHSAVRARAHAGRLAQDRDR
jgi:type II secretion system protein N